MVSTAWRVHFTVRERVMVQQESVSPAAMETGGHEPFFKLVKLQIRHNRCASLKVFKTECHPGLENPERILPNNGPRHATCQERFIIIYHHRFPKSSLYSDQHCRGVVKVDFNPTDCYWTLKTTVDRAVAATSCCYWNKNCLLFCIRQFVLLFTILHMCSCPCGHKYTLTSNNWVGTYYTPPHNPRGLHLIEW